MMKQTLKLNIKKRKFKTEKARQGLHYGRNEETTMEIKPRRGDIMVATEMQIYLSPIWAKLLNLKPYVFGFQ